MKLSLPLSFLLCQNTLKIQMQIEKEETGTLDQQPGEQCPVHSKVNKNKTLFAGRSKSLTFFVGFTSGAIVAFLLSWQSWIIQRTTQDNLQSVTSQTKTDLSTSQNTPYVKEDCAQHTFLALHKHQPERAGGGGGGGGGGGEENFCIGMLLRDDIILTSQECSQSPAFFEFISGSGVFLEAVPHTALNAIMGLHPLGFLLAKDAPWHYLFLDRPVRRARMFLSLQSKPNIADDHDARAVPPYITCKGYRPIAHNFPLPNGEMIPIGEELLKVDLPKDLVLWEHADLESAPELTNDKGERWWTKAITLEQGEEVFQGYFATPKMKGPKGSISLVRAHTDFIGKAGGICEAFDPRGHRRNVCFGDYIERWKMQQPFSGMHFFDWLDYGSGKLLFEMNQKYNFLPDVVDEDCLKKYFNAETVHYFNATEREAHKIYLSSAKDGQEVIARYKQSNEVVGQNYDDKPHLYMFGLNRQMYIVDKNLWDKAKYGTVKHTAVLAGSPALSAGEAYFKENGVISEINFNSGHYRPKITAATMMYHWMKDQSLNTSAFNWMAEKSWSVEDCNETDWKGFEIRDYDANVLEKTCQDITASSTWFINSD